MLAEDNRVNQRLVVGILGKQGYVVTIVGTGRLAVEAYRDNFFDLILMDVQMPEMNGYEAVQHIRDYEARTAIRTPIIALTAHAMSGDREKCIAAGMDAYLTKPLQKDELLITIAKLMNAGALTKRPEAVVRGTSEKQVMSTQ